MICSSCGAQNEPGRKFCGECAARLAAICPACGASNAPTVKFCGECATPLGPGPAPALAAAHPAPAPSTPAPVAERRLVSVLFADLVGFTTLAEGRDAEETRELLTRYFDLSREVIERYGGAVEKFIGDAVMAVWGAPVAHEDDAERSVRAALDLVDTVRTLGPGIVARAGVLTGEAAITIGATDQGMVAGDLVNTASRLQSAAAPGTVLVGEATQRAASAAIAFEPAGEQSLKGKAVPIAAWVALRVVAERGGRRRADTLEAPFVGRDEELRLLKELFHATSREKRARLVSVIGPAGIGKSRLAWEFSKYLDGLVEQVWWHDGRSPAYGDGISFWALGEMVRERCGLLEADDAQTTRAKVAATLAQHVPDETERRWIEPALLALLGIETGTSSEQLFGAWRAFFERLAATGPVVMIFEDLHYADPGLLDFIDHLLGWSRGMPIYVVTLARPELLEKRPDWAVGKRTFNSLYLEPLAAGAMRALLAGLVPGLPEQAVRAIVSRADGVPLYAVETVRMLLADGRLRAERGAYVPVGDLTTLAVPESLTALIASRLDALAPDDRALVSDAAVLGQSFTVAGLAAVSGVGPEALEPHLRSLVRRELLTLEADPRSPELGQYTFVQALIREVGYNTLAKRDRKARHLAAARFFESLGSDELAGGLAGHYLAAHDNAAAGPEADALAVQARIALSAAAERAAGLGSHEQAVVFLRQALTLTTDRAEEAELGERAGESAAAAGHFEEAEALLQRAIDLRRELGDRPAIARAVAGLGMALIDGWRVERAIAILSTHSSEFADLLPDPAIIALDAQLSRGYMLNAEYRRAIEVADRVLEAAERSDLVDIVADVLVTRGTALSSLGRGYEGGGAIEAGEHLAAACGLHRTVLRALGNRAAGLTDADPRAGLEVARTALALEQRVGRRSAQSIRMVTAMATRVGEWAWALEVLEATLADTTEPSLRAELLGDIVGFRALRGEPIAEMMRELADVVGNETEPYLLGDLYWARFSDAFASGKYAVARAEMLRLGELFPDYDPSAGSFGTRAALLARDAAGVSADLAASEVIGKRGPALRADRATMRAGLAALDGRPSDALDGYRPALIAWRDLGLAWDEALAGFDMAMLLGPSHVEVRAAADAARDILTRLRAQPFLDRLDAAMARGDVARVTEVH